MHYYLYEIRNILNDKIYVGVHKTKNLDDGYMGSGKVIKRAIEKHGVENFTKTILETFEDATSMYAREKEVVTDEFLAREDTYNLRRGGTGGFDFINSTNTNVTINEQRRLNPEKVNEWYEKTRVGHKRYLENTPGAAKVNSKLAISALKEKYPEGVWKGKTHTEETKRRMSEKAKLRTGIKNSSFGKCWVTNGHENKMIRKDDLSLYINDNWYKGRKL